MKVTDDLVPNDVAADNLAPDDLDKDNLGTAVISR